MSEVQDSKISLSTNPLNVLPTSGSLRAASPAKSSWPTMENRVRANKFNHFARSHEGHQCASQRDLKPAGAGRRGLMSRLGHQVGRLLLALAAATGILHAQQHPQQPSVNLGDTSFLDALGAPGVLLEQIGDASHSGMKTDGMGQAVAGAPAVNSISGLTHGVDLTKHKLLGAWWGFEAIVPAAHVNAGSGGVAGGFGDLTVSPLVLQWKALKFGSSQLNQRFVLDFEVPVGEYRQDTPVSLSGHAFTVHPYYVFTFFPTKKVETSWRVHYLYSGVNNDPSVGNHARSSQAGQVIHFNATAAYGLPHGVWIGANGYLLKQITDPQVNGLAISSSPEQVGAIGPGLLWDRGQYLLYANGYHEFGALNRPEGNKLVLRVQWVPGRHAGIDGPQ
jgi:hypothetical protein